MKSIYSYISFKSNKGRVMFTLNCKGRLLTITSPLVMGILNTTPDSFFTGSRVSHINSVLSRAEQMLKEGATFLDLGGQSTRPGSETVPAEEELHRVIPAVKAIHAAFPEALISIDTFYASVAKAAVEAGACLVNDVSAGSLDHQLLPTVAALNVPYVLMHMKGHPQTMQNNPAYENVVTEVFDTLSFKAAELTRMGINDIIIDPGFGFGKTIPHNLTLLQQLPYLGQLQKPLMAGISRKGTVYKTLGVTPEEALNGTTVLHTIALLNGASILRVHDVKEALEAIRLTEAYKQAPALA
jgi:dihydropteroate synthase